MTKEKSLVGSCLFQSEALRMEVSVTRPQRCILTPNCMEHFCIDKTISGRGNVSKKSLRTANSRIPKRLFWQRTAFSIGWLMIGHHFITICHSGTRALPDTGHDLGGRLDWIGSVCLHDLLPAVHSFWRGAVRWVSDTFPICVASLLDRRSWCIFVLSLQVVSASLGSVQCREHEMEPISCDVEKHMVRSSVLSSSRTLLKFGHLKCDSQTCLTLLFERAVLHCKRKVEPVTHPFFIFCHHRWGCCTADGHCKTYFPASALSMALKTPGNIDRLVDVFTDLVDWSHNESTLTCCSWFQVLNVGQRQIVWRDIN